MTENRVPYGGEPIAATLAQRVLITLLEHGRWDDAATYYPTIEHPDSGVHAKLLLAAGHVAEAGVLLAAKTGPADAQLTFLNSAHSVLTQDQLGFPQLVAEESPLWWWGLRSVGGAS